MTTARKNPLLLSVIMPAYNEASTIAQVLEPLLAKQLDGIDIEIVLVESNSTDETREIVRGFEPHPRLRVVLEDRPRGKGFAVRTGLARARGDIVLIQDADLEYDLDDYAALLKPIVESRARFVLGTRHSKERKAMRQFEGARALSAYYNMGHWVLTWMINILYGVRLTDPFTMYKVFRRECIAGMEFECDRFDFDHEIVCKMLRAGYTPLEVPVRYSSRSFAQGKKIQTFRDPPTWIRAMVKYRFTAPVVHRSAAAVAEEETELARG